MISVEPIPDAALAVYRSLEFSERWFKHGRLDLVNILLSAASDRPYGTDDSGDVRHLCLPYRDNHLACHIRFPALAPALALRCRSKTTVSWNRRTTLRICSATLTAQF